MTDQNANPPIGASPVASPQGASPDIAPPQGASPEDTSLGEDIKKLGKQGLAGIDDVTWLLSRAITSHTGDIKIPLDKGPLGAITGMHYVSPEELQKQHEQGLIGIPGRATEGPDSLLESGMRMAGQTATAGPILGKLFGLVAAPAEGTTGFIAGTRRFASTVGKTYAKSPGKALTSDIVSGFGAGSGGYIAQQLDPDSPTVKFLGELIGGTAPLISPTRLVIKASGGIKNIINTIRHPFTEAGGRLRAGGRLARGMAGQSRKAAIHELNQPTTIDPATGQPVLTPAQRTGEPGLLSLEKSIVESSDTSMTASNEQIANANRIIQTNLSDVASGNVATAKTRIQDAQDYMRYLLDTRLKMAAQATDARLADLGKGYTREHANRIAREEIENALSSARAQENELFSAIPENTAVPFTETANKLKYLLTSTSKAQQGDIPSIAKRLLDPESKDFIGNIKGMDQGETSIKELRGLQSKLREVARNARAGDNKKLNLARVADDLANTITSDLEHTRGGQGSTAEETAKAVQIAVDFSREVNQRFGSPTVAKILGRTGTGAAKIPSGLTLEETIGVAGPKARESMDQILNAFDTPQVEGHSQIIQATSDYMRAKFLKATTMNGSFNVNYAKRFLSNNEEILKRMPDLHAQLEEATKTGNKFAVTVRQNARVKLDDPRVSKATMLLQKGPVETFHSIAQLEPKKMATETQKLINTVSKDTTGESMDGLRSGMMEYLFKQSRLPGRDMAGQQFMSGYKFQETMQKMGPAVKKLFTPDQLSRIDQIQKDLILLEKRIGTNASKEGMLGDKPSKMVEMVARLAGAKLGTIFARETKTGGIQAQAIVSQRFKELANAGVADPASRLLRDSVFDEKLYRDLLSIDLKPGEKLPKEAARRLNSWAYLVAAEYGANLSEDNEQ